MRSVFQEPTWRNHRHFLNPSKLKEYELHAAGLGFLNAISPFRDYQERFTPLDPITEETLRPLHRKSTLHVIRKSLSKEELAALERAGFILSRTWGTFIIDTSLPLHLDTGTTKNIRRAERTLAFSPANNMEDLREYYELLKSSRKGLGFRTPAFRPFRKLFSNPHYTVFMVRQQDNSKLVAAMGTIHNDNYLIEVQAGREKDPYYANDYLKYMIIEYCRKSGIRWYDLAGCNPEPAEGSKDAAIRRFKEKWGGEFHYEFVFRRT